MFPNENSNTQNENFTNSSSYKQDEIVEDYHNSLCASETGALQDNNRSDKQVIIVCFYQNIKFFICFFVCTFTDRKRKICAFFTLNKEQ